MTVDQWTYCVVRDRDGVHQMREESEVRFDDSVVEPGLPYREALRLLIELLEVSLVMQS